MFASRHLPIAAFSALWEEIFLFFLTHGEAEVVAAIQRHYMSRTDGIWDAGWRGSLVQPGSYSGTQAQERWHGSRLRATFEQTRLPVDSVVASLEELATSRCEQAVLKVDEPLYDIPAGHYSKHLEVLAKQALQLTDFLHEEDDADGTKLIMMRQDYSSEAISQYKTKASKQIFRSVRALYLDGELLKCDDLESLCQEVTRWVLVLIGPRAMQEWKCSPEAAEAAGELPASHAHCVCLGCHAFAVGGCCLHSYAGMAKVQLVGRPVAWPEPHKKGQARKMRKSLLPGAKHVRPKVSSKPVQKGHAGHEVDKEHAALRRCLERHGLIAHLGAFVENELWLTELREWSVVDLHKLLGLPAAKLRRLLHDVQTDGSAEAGVFVWICSI